MRIPLVLCFAATAGLLAQVRFAPDVLAVTVDGIHATVAPLKTISLNQKYFFS